MRDSDIDTKQYSPKEYKHISSLKIEGFYLKLLNLHNRFDVSHRDLFIVSEKLMLNSIRLLTY